MIKKHNLGNLDKFTHSDTLVKSKLQITLKTKHRTWRVDDYIIYYNSNGRCEGYFYGFYENSALVKDKKYKSISCVSYRNIIDPATDEPFIKTVKRYGKNGALINAYIPKEK